MKSVMNHSFSQVPVADIPRSKFNRTHGYKTTFDAGTIIPIFVDEALPGDTFKMDCTTFARLATPLHPIMDNMFLDTHFFSVPLRLVWDNFQKFMGEQTDPGDSTDFLIPTITSTAVTGYANSTIYDYMGIPTEIPGIEHSALFLRAYNLIWNEWYRDQNLQDSVAVARDDGPDLPADYELLPRGKRHDYFTSCLPWPQKGPAVPLPLGTTAPVIGAQNDEFLFSSSTTTPSGTDIPTALRWNASSLNPGVYGDASNGVNLISTNGLFSNMVADLSTATAATINQLRQAFQIQKLYERDARGGTRYIELLKSHFQVTSPDYRLQRPEYLGGGTQTITINPIAQTSATASEPTPQGNVAGFGVTSGFSGFSHSFTEHSIVLGFASVRADLNYQQGLNRMWSRQTRWDFYWPALAHIGEQAVLNKEIYAQGTSADEDVFGYQERYAEYRYKPSLVTGQMRSNFAQSLDTWHLCQEFGSLPLLNAAFIEENPPIDRIIAVPSAPHFLFDSYFDFICERPMPTYSVPGLIDHF